MGQSNSRLQQQSNQTAPQINSNRSPSGANADSDPDDLLDVDGDVSNASPSRRSSFRKSILKLVKPSTSRNQDINNGANAGESRRSWRNSRRWSKAQRIPVIHEESDSGPSQGSSTEPSSTPPCTSVKGKQREVLPASEEHDDHAALTLNESPPLLASVEAENPATSVKHITNADDSSITSSQHFESSLQHDSRVDPGSDVSSQHSSSTPAEEDNNGASSPPASVPSQQAPSSLHRQFPPPGTLVVVQGIVHTTDVSRSDNSTLPVTNMADTSTQSSTTTSTQPDQGVPRSRNRLSALLRPRSASRPASSIIGDSNSATAIPVSRTESLHMTTADSQALAGELAATPAPPEVPHLVSQDPLPVRENRAPLISPSSIDVLGTLLSVAAAATAASLLTGSSEPILSSGLAPHHPAIPSQHVPHSTSNPAISNPPSYAPPNDNAGFPDVVPGRSDRMRHAWGTIRERLGLRPSSVHEDEMGPHHLNTTAEVHGSSTADGTDLGTPIDTRELMLAEMARAFNIGLGLNGLGGLASGSSSTAGHQDQDGPSNAGNPSDSRPSETANNGSQSQSQSVSESASTAVVPPEGSFERFLVDLQTDLRIALTRTEDESDAEDNQAAHQEAIQTESHHIQPPSDANHLPSPVNVDESVRQASGGIDRTAYPLAAPSSHEELDFSDLPPLQDLSDLESDFEEDDHDNDDYGDEDFQSAEQRYTRDGDRDGDRVSALQDPSGTGRIDAAGRINWWRLYRFPPIISPQADIHRPTTTSTTPAPTRAAANDASASVPVTADQAPGSVESIHHTPLTQPLNTSTSPLSSSVVPVIVVGLQSVNSEWRADLPEQPEGVDLFGQTPLERGPEDDQDGSDDLDGWGGHHHIAGGGDGARGRGRSRGWQSRAAEAIRSLRPGRRSTEAGTSAQLPAITPGSRTFLIYVIGGYYPPDHSIVTGGPNILDSFEALLELADLLGQVKPPTATKDDIEKSGLEIINASELPQHEKDGKVSSNCLDRCLICLDDYENDDPIRVMSCRHAFHKKCVDEWLQKGRNNCPACRSTGVTTDGYPTTSFPTPM